MDKKVRIGIDVGGTFTDAVIIDNQTGKIIDKAKIPTTHYADNGVAQGIIEIVKQIMEKNKINPEDVVFIAHGTTQATNALLEGDVAKVGVIGMGTSKLAQKEVTVENIELAPNKYLMIETEFINSNNVNQSTIKEALDKLVAKGCQVFVASEEYSIDNPDNELMVVDEIQKNNYFATAGHYISELYGLKVRTKTSIVNASLIPKMMETANMTEQVVKQLKISSELMIMRADGGVMSINEVRKRPILTMLSGLAAGVAGALMHEKVTDGVFMEVGGTSIDISVIKGGKVIVSNATIGGHKTYLKALDVQTLAIAGGSMIRVKDQKVIDVGPRSAHLANKEYECFANAQQFEDLKFTFTAPLAGDSNDYVCFENNEKHYALTLAGAANYLGYVPENDYAYANQTINNQVWEQFGEFMNQPATELAKQVLDIAINKVWHVIHPMINYYELDSKFLQLIGGGGSAAVITPYLAKQKDITGKIASNAPYISTIGVALALVREQIERSIMNPSTSDIQKIRNDVINKIIESGAKKETIQVDIQIDVQKNIVTATATGATEFSNDHQINNEFDDQKISKMLAQGYKVEIAKVRQINANKSFVVYQIDVPKSKFFGLMKKEISHFCVAKKEGVILFKGENIVVEKVNKANINNALEAIIENASTYSDAGKTIPKIAMFSDYQNFDYSGLVDEAQVKAMLALDIENITPEEEIFLVAKSK